MSVPVDISNDEFTAMEQLLATLLAGADSASEEAEILNLHSRLEKIYERSNKLNASRSRLWQVV